MITKRVFITCSKLIKFNIFPEFTWRKILYPSRNAKLYRKQIKYKFKAATVYQALRFLMSSQIERDVTNETKAVNKQNWHGPKYAHWVQTHHKNEAPKYEALRNCISGYNLARGDQVQ